MTCPLPHRVDPERPRPAVRLCAGHTAALGHMFTDAPTLDADLAVMLTGGGRGGERITGSPTTGITLNAAVVEARSGLYAVLASWARVVVEDRDVHAPTATLGAVAVFLTRHAAWLADQPFAEDVFTEVATVTETGRRHAYPDGRRTFDVSPCPTVVACTVTDRAELPCPGRLRAVIRDTDSLLPSALRCTSCGSEWSAGEWVQLGRLLHPEAAA